MDGCTILSNVIMINPITASTSVAFIIVTSLITLATEGPKQVPDDPHDTHGPKNSHHRKIHSPSRCRSGSGVGGRRRRRQRP